MFGGDFYYVKRACGNRRFDKDRARRTTNAQAMNATLTHKAKKYKIKLQYIGRKNEPLVQ